MPQSNCETCGGVGQLMWRWEEAFDKFGFNDGDGQVETWQVRNVLEDAGYDVTEIAWGLHNVIIHSIKKGGIELIPESATVGYDDPRDYLPAAIIEILDGSLGGWQS